MRTRPRSARLRSREPGPGGRPRLPHRRPRQKRKKKKKGKGHWGRGRGGGREPQVPPQKIPRNGEGSLLSSSRPPPRKLSGNYFQPPRALLTLSSTSRRTKPFLGKARGRPLGRGKGSLEPLSHCLLPDPLGTTEVMGVTPSQRAAWGSGRVAAAGTSTSENAACPRMDPRIYI